MPKNNTIQIDKESYFHLIEFDEQYLTVGEEEDEDLEQILLDNPDRQPVFEVVDTSWVGGDFLETVHVRKVVKFFHNNNFYQMNYRPHKDGRVEVLDEGVDVGNRKCDLNALYVLNEVEMKEGIFFE